VGVERRLPHADIQVMKKVFAFAARDEGQTMAEYGTVLTIITVACLTAFLLLAASATSAYERIATLLG
jgi:Flp pilus assembly pilin Flp